MNNIVKSDRFQLIKESRENDLTAHEQTISNFRSEIKELSDIWEKDTSYRLYLMECLLDMNLYPLSSEPNELKFATKFLANGNVENHLFHHIRQHTHSKMMKKLLKAPIRIDSYKDYIPEGSNIMETYFMIHKLILEGISSYCPFLINKKRAYNEFFHQTSKMVENQYDMENLYLLFLDSKPQTGSETYRDLIDTNTTTEILKLVK